MTTPREVMAALRQGLTYYRASERASDPQTVRSARLMAKSYILWSLKELKKIEDAKDPPRS